MIRFTCQCGKQYQVSEKYAGKKVRCKKCNNMVRVPSDNNEDSAVIVTNIIEVSDNRQTIDAKSEPPAPIKSEPANINPQSFSGRSEHESSVTFLGLPKFVAYFIGASLCCFGLFCGGMLLFRDTWDIDNYSKIAGLVENAHELVLRGQIKDGIKAYDGVFQIVGKRTIKVVNLKKLLDEANGEYANIKNDWPILYVPILAYKSEINRLKQLGDLEGAIALSGKAIEEYQPKDKHGKFLRPILLEIRKLGESIENNITSAKQKELNELVPKLATQYKDAHRFIATSQYDLALVNFESIISQQSSKLWTDDAKQILRNTINEVNEVREMAEQQSILVKEKYNSEHPYILTVQNIKEYVDKLFRPIAKNELEISENSDSSLLVSHNHFQCVLLKHFSFSKPYLEEIYEGSALSLNPESHTKGNKIYWDVRWEDHVFFNIDLERSDNEVLWAIIYREPPPIRRPQHVTGLIGVYSRTIPAQLFILELSLKNFDKKTVSDMRKHIEQDKPLLIRWSVDFNALPTLESQQRLYSNEEDSSSLNRFTLPGKLDYLKFLEENDANVRLFRKDFAEQRQANKIEGDRLSSAVKNGNVPELNYALANSEAAIRKQQGDEFARQNEENITAARAVAKALPDRVVNYINNACGIFKRMEFAGTRPEGQGTNYRYNVEYVTQDRSIRAGTLDVLIEENACIEVYFNGREWWMTGIGAGKMGNYRNPP